MPYNASLVDRIREHLLNFPDLEIEEKEMFRGLTFMINGKMCISVSGENLMCRFDPALQGEVAELRGFEPMIMKGRQLNGYCYIAPEGFRSGKDFQHILQLCLDYNKYAKSSKKKSES
jgi:isopenicillin N synthase-like dioxygenase